MHYNKSQVLFTEQIVSNSLFCFYSIYDLQIEFKNLKAPILTTLNIKNGKIKFEMLSWYRV